VINTKHHQLPAFLFFFFSRDERVASSKNVPHVYMVYKALSGSFKQLGHNLGLYQMMRMSYLERVCVCVCVRACACACINDIAS